MEQSAVEQEVHRIPPLLFGITVGLPFAWPPLSRHTMPVSLRTLTLLPSTLRTPRPSRTTRMGERKGRVAPRTINHAQQRPLPHHLCDPEQQPCSFCQRRRVQLIEREQQRHKPRVAQGVFQSGIEGRAEEVHDEQFWLKGLSAEQRSRGRRGVGRRRRGSDESIVQRGQHSAPVRDVDGCDVELLVLLASPALLRRRR